MTPYVRILNRLSRLLRRRSMTAREIAEHFGCCKPQAYARVKALQARGENVVSIPVDSRRPGPRAVAYWIVR